MRASVSAKLIPEALTAIRISPGPTGGSGRSWTSSTSGGPCLLMATALMRGPYLYQPGQVGMMASCSEVHRATGLKPVEAQDLLEQLLRHGGVGSQRQDGLVTGCLRADGRG